MSTNSRHRGPQSTGYLPPYLERYADEVDEWHREALARRAARRAAPSHATG